jgi:hypothetical protein
MLLPALSDPACIEQVSFAQPSFCKKILCPIAQWTAQPLAEWNAKSHFRPVNEVFRYMAAKHLPQ